MQGSNLAARLPDPPDWLGDFIAHLAARHGPARACTMITVLGRLLEDEHPGHPQAVLERARRPGRSMGSLARALEGFFTTRGLALPTDQDERLAAGRRRRRIGAVPEPLRPAADAFGTFMLRARERALRAGTRPRADETIETALATIRDFGRFMDSDLGKRDWALAGVHDMEAFLVTLPKARKRRMTVLSQFFRFARTQKVVLVARPADCPPGSRPGSPARPSCWNGSANCSAAGRPARTLTRTNPCSGSWAWCTQCPAWRSAAFAWTTSTTVPGPSGWARGPTRCRSTPPAGMSCNAASPTGKPRPPRTPT